MWGWLGTSEDVTLPSRDLHHQCATAIASLVTSLKSLPVHQCLVGKALRSCDKKQLLSMSVLDAVPLGWPLACPKHVNVAGP